MNDKSGDFEPAHMTDEDLDLWLHDVNEDIGETLDRVVDTEGALLRLKQSIATEAVAVAHASGSDGADRAIRSVLSHGDPAPDPVKSEAAQRTALGRAARLFQRMAASDASSRSIARATVALAVGAAGLMAAMIPLLVEAAGNDSRTAPPPGLILASLAMSGLALVSVVTSVLRTSRQRPPLAGLLNFPPMNTRSYIDALNRDRKLAKKERRKRRREKIGKAAVLWVARVLPSPPVYFLSNDRPDTTLLLHEPETALHPRQGGEEESEDEQDLLPDDPAQRPAELIGAGSVAVRYSREPRKPVRIVRPAARPSLRGSSKPAHARRRRRRKGR